MKLALTPDICTIKRFFWKWSPGSSKFILLWHVHSSLNNLLFGEIWNDVRLSMFTYSFSFQSLNIHLLSFYFVQQRHEVSKARGEYRMILLTSTYKNTETLGPEKSSCLSSTKLPKWQSKGKFSLFPSPCYTCTNAIFLRIYQKFNKLTDQKITIGVILGLINMFA